MLHLLGEQQKKFVALVMILSLLTACTLSLDKHQIEKNISKTPGIDSLTQSYTTPSSAMQSGPWPKEQWWESFHFPKLNTLVTMGLNNNPNIKALRAHLDSAIEDSNINRAALSPWVQLHAQTNEQYRSKNGIYRALNPNIPLDGHEVDFNGSFRYEFDFWGQNYNRFQASIGYQKVRQAELAYTRLLTAVSISESFLHYQATVITLDCYQTLQTILQKEERLNNYLLQKNIDSKFPSLRTQFRKETVQQTIAKLQAKRLHYQHFINQMLARNPEQPISVHKVFKPLSHRLNVPKSIELNLISRRPELMARRWEAEARAYQVGAAMADYYPNINLIGLVGLESVAWETLLRSASTTALLRPAIYLPVFTAGAIKANIRKTHAKFNQAVFEYNAALFSAISEVLDNLAQMRASHQQFQLEEKKLAVARNNLSLAQLRQNAGIDNELQIYFFEKQLIENKIKLIHKNLAQYIAAVRLIQSLGGGYCNQDIPRQKDT